MNPFSAARAWHWPMGVHNAINHLFGYRVIETRGETTTYRWASDLDYALTVLAPARERFEQALATRDAA